MTHRSPASPTPNWQRDHIVREVLREMIGHRPGDSWYVTGGVLSRAHTIALLFDSEQRQMFADNLRPPTPVPDFPADSPPEVYSRYINDFHDLTVADAVGLLTWARISAPPSWAFHVFDRAYPPPR